MSDLVTNLTEACNGARRAGFDFPTIWKEILSQHPLVTGVPLQTLSEAGPVLEIPLFAGQTLLFGATGFSLK